MNYKFKTNYKLKILFELWKLEENHAEHERFTVASLC